MALQPCQTPILHFLSLNISIMVMLISHSPFFSNDLKQSFSISSVSVLISSWNLVFIFASNWCNWFVLYIQILPFLMKVAIVNSIFLLLLAADKRSDARALYWSRPDAWEHAHRIWMPLLYNSSMFRNSLHAGRWGLFVCLFMGNCCLVV